MRKINNWLTMELVFLALCITTHTVYADGLTVDSAGRVGIGVETPFNTLHIHDDVGVVRITNPGTGIHSSDGMFMGHSNNNETSFDFWNYENNFIRFATNNTERLRIDNEGRLGIGTSSPGANLEITSVGSPDFFRVGMLGCGRGIVIKRVTDTPGIQGYNTSDWTTPAPISLQGNGGNVGINTNVPYYPLDVNGTARVTSLIQSSDERLKEDIQPVNEPLDKLSKIRGVSYKWNDIAKRKQKRRTQNKEQAAPFDPTLDLDQFNSRTHMGLLAQEVEQVFPEAVYTDKNGMKSIAYSQLIAPMLEAIKELHQENEELKSELTVIKTMLERQ